MIQARVQFGELQAPSLLCESPLKQLLHQIHRSFSRNLFILGTSEQVTTSNRICMTFSATSLAVKFNTCSVEP